MKRKHFAAIETEDPRVVSGKALVTSLCGQVPELQYHDVKETPADGLCFLHAVLQQLRIDDGGSEWQVAMAVIQSLATNRHMWKDHLPSDEEQHEQN